MKLLVESDHRATMSECYHIPTKAEEVKGPPRRQHAAQFQLSAVTGFWGHQIGFPAVRVQMKEDLQ
jgi:hypothetical protein